MYQTHEDEMRGAIGPLIEAILDAEPQATDEQVARLVEVEKGFADFFKMRGTAAIAMGWDIPSRAELVEKVQRQRLLRLCGKML